MKMSILMASRSMMLTASFILAALGTLLAPPIVNRITGNGALSGYMLLPCCCVIGPVWILSAVLLLCHLGKRGLWVLLGFRSPFVVLALSSYCSPRVQLGLTVRS